jgi:FMN phosphatase YigB (HAD superfamily)
MVVIEAILFDVGNVLIEWDPRHLYRKLLPSEEAVEEFLSKICTLEWHFAHDQGVSFEENALPLKEQYPEHAELIDQWGGRYMEMAPQEVVGMSALVNRAKSVGLGIHGLTNMPTPTFPMLLERFPVMRQLETVVVSGDEKVCKPEPRIFELALERMGADADKVLFVDDSMPNIDAAKAMGFHVHHFSQSDHLARQLADLGVSL